MQVTKLNIGAGDKKLPGFTPIDRKLGTEAYPLPASIADDSVEEVRASHVLEHFPFKKVLLVLQDWYRVLKPGGRMRIAVPDFDKIVDMKGDPKRFAYLMGGQSDENDFHQSVFTKEMLSQALTEAGLVNVQEWESDGLDTSRHPVSLNLEGYKPGLDDDMLVRIRGVMSIPRVGWNDHWGCHQEALEPFKIPVMRHSGAFWSHGMDQMFNRCVDDNTDWMLCMDYDTMFTAEHLDTLIGAMGQNPEIDAIAAMQPRRGHKEHPLITLSSELGDRHIEVDIRKPLQVDTAHFGLTLIRVDALRNMPKPWFNSKPGEDGTWEDPTHIDPDIWFWKRWKDCGNTVYVHPGVRVGHLQIMVSEMADDLQGVEHMHVTQWRDRYVKKEDQGE